MGKQTSNLCSLQNYENLVKKLDGMEGVDAKKVIQKCTRDAKTRAPAWISAAVSEEYGIKKADVKATLKSVALGKSTIKLEGGLADSISFKYNGRLLTPTHFKMKPKSRKKKKYKVSQEVFKGRRKNLPPGVFLAPAGGSGTVQIPFQRTGSSRRSPIESIKTVSVPQMITNEKVAENIQKSIDEGLSKRLENHVKQMIKKLEDS